MMEKTEGTIQDVVGRVQDAVGAATEDPGMQVAGKVRKAAGKVQQTYGEALEGLRDTASANPITTLSVVAAASFLLGVIWARRE